MRKALDSNPVIQVMLVAVLLIGVAFLFATRVLQREEGGAPTEGAATSQAAAPATGAAGAPPVAADSAGSLPGVAASPPEEAVGKFEAGPGLPAAVVDTYRGGDTVALLITRRVGIDDREVRSLVERLRSRGDVGVFTSNAGKIARYSRITRGVDVSRVPALVVLRPKRATDGPPRASVSYGFRSAESVLQAIRDANYRGRRNIPYYPE